MTENDRLPRDCDWRTGHGPWSWSPDTFDVEYHPSHVWKLLRSFGFSCQKPEQDAREQDPDEVRRWIEEEWPRIKETARKERCMIGFLDEFGLMLQPVRRRTWAPKGKTPRQKVWDRHDRLSGIGIICATPAGRRMSFAFQLLPHNVTAEDLVWYLEAMHDHVGRKVILVWDRWNVHRSVTNHFEHHHPTWFQFEDLPGYSPELNPIEQCWKHCKYDDLANFIPDDVDNLHAAATDSLESMRYDQEFLRSTFQYCGLAL